MKITLSAVRRDETLVVHRQGAVLTVNGEAFDFSRMQDGDTLPASAVASLWFADNTDIDCVGGELELTMILPYPEVHSPAQAFPIPLLSVPDGPVEFPQGPVPSSDPVNQVTGAHGVIDWGQLATKESKDQAELQRVTLAVQTEVAARRAEADYSIAPLQDAVDLDDATDSETTALKAWKKYRVALSRVPDQAGYPETIDWPAAPA